jgi:hypothetical protein
MAGPRLTVSPASGAGDRNRTAGSPLAAQTDRCGSLAGQCGGLPLPRAAAVILRGGAAGWCGWRAADLQYLLPVKLTDQTAATITTAGR